MYPRFLCKEAAHERATRRIGKTLRKVNKYTVKKRGLAASQNPRGGFLVVLLPHYALCEELGAGVFPDYRYHVARANTGEV